MFQTLLFRGGTNGGGRGEADLRLCVFTIAAAAASVLASLGKTIFT